MTDTKFRFNNQTLDTINTEVAFGTDGNIYLTNISRDKVVDLIAVPLAAWTDRDVMKRLVVRVGIARGIW